MAGVGDWILWWAIGAAVVLIAAGLLIWILLVARGIEKQAVRAREAARRLKVATDPAWTLIGAVHALEDVRSSVESIEPPEGATDKLVTEELPT